MEASNNVVIKVKIGDEEEGEQLRGATRKGKSLNTGEWRHRPVTCDQLGRKKKCKVFIIFPKAWRRWCGRQS